MHDFKNIGLHELKKLTKSMVAVSKSKITANHRNFVPNKFTSRSKIFGWFKIMIHNLILTVQKLQSTIVILGGPQSQPSMVILDGPKLRPIIVILYGPKLQLPIVYCTIQNYNLQP